MSKNHLDSRDGREVYILAVETDKFERTEFEVHTSEQDCFRSLLQCFASFGRTYFRKPVGAPDLEQIEDEEHYDPIWAARYRKAVEAEDWKRAFLLWQTDIEDSGDEDPHYPSLAYVGQSNITFAIRRQWIGSRGDGDLVASSEDLRRLPETEDTPKAAEA